ncbi:hypothetical protein GOODEAATRI_022417 [Goodea atripinnis]|uniref:Reverse transcriptase n=1 Tax=Goodea atripinnis TaxID=208336 RepID=A0ABV0MU89_9TELE
MLLKSSNKDPGNPKSAWETDINMLFTYSEWDRILRNVNRLSRCWYLLSSDSSSTSVSSISGMLWMRSLMRNSGWAMKLWMELRDSGFSRPSYKELRNAFTTRICQGAER